MGIPKPKHCDQDWLDMTPTEGGRVCGKCEKTIVDFTKMKWNQIDSIQKENNNGVCGMYTNRQLDNWGQEPSRFGRFGKTAATSSLILMLSQLNAVDAAAQVNDSSFVEISIIGNDTTEIVKNDTLEYFIRGVVYDENWTPIEYARVRLTDEFNTTIAGAYSDDDGLFSIKIKGVKAELEKTTLMVRRDVGNEERPFRTEKIIEIMSNNNIILREEVSQLISFSVRVPTKKQLRKMEKEDKRLKKEQEGS